MASHRLGTLSYFRDRYHFPLSSGPYSVGSVDLATSKIFFRLYYPHGFHSSPKAKREILEANHQRWTKWLPEPEYAGAYLSFKYSKPVPAVLGRMFQWLSCDPYLPNIEHASLVGEDVVGSLPLIVFSHGNGGCRTTYSMLCSEMASKGYLVAALEHHDGSASLARTLGPDGLEWIRPRVVQGEDYAIRNEQAQIRSLECQLAVNTLQSLNRGAGQEVHKPFDPENAFPLDSLHHRINLDGGVAIAGHSFGGATAIKALMENESFKTGFCLDSWMFPIREEAQQLASVQKSLFFINYEKFQWKRNLHTMRIFERGSISTSQPPLDTTSTNVFTIKAAIHYVATDLPLVFAGSYVKYPLAVLEWLSLLRMPRWTALPAYAPEGDAGITDEILSPLDGLALSLELFTSFLDVDFASRGSNQSPDNLAEQISENGAYLIPGTRFLDVAETSPKN